jgi:16S rRNA (uracil1498-N3)-methyltransferase
MRLGEGSEIAVADGKGSIYKARIERADPNNCRVAVIDRAEQPRLWKRSLHIAIAPTKNADRTEWLKSCCTNLSVTQIPQNGIVFEVRQGYKCRGLQNRNSFNSKNTLGCKLKYHSTLESLT